MTGQPDPEGRGGPGRKRRKRRKRFEASRLRRHSFDPETGLCWRCGRWEQDVLDHLLPCFEADNILSIVPEIVRRSLRRDVDPGPEGSAT